LIRAHEGNTDDNPDMAGKVHWGKYNMIGKFIKATTQCQAQCRNSTEYNFPERLHISNLIFTVTSMNEDVCLFYFIHWPVDEYSSLDAEIKDRTTNRFRHD
jgi:hypothetical protein